MKEYFWCMTLSHQFDDGRVMTSGFKGTHLFEEDADNTAWVRFNTILDYVIGRKPDMTNPIVVFYHIEPN